MSEEQATAITEQAETATEQQEQQTQQQEKTFTQSDVDKMIKSRLDRANKALENTDEYKAYKLWQETQKTDNERIQEQLKDYETKHNTLLAENQKYKIEAKGIDPVFSKFISLEVNAIMADRNIDFEEALNEFLKETGDKFLKKQETPESKQRFYMPMANTTTQGITKDQFNNMSYKEKTQLYSNNPNLYQTLKG